MRGVVFTGNRAAEIREFPDPQAGPGEAVVKVRASGLCGTDLHRYRAAEPTEMITGHEPCGVIAELGPGAPDGLALGDRDRKSTRLNSSHLVISYAVFCLKKKKKKKYRIV